MLLGVDVTDHKMLQPIINNLNCKRIVLASSSPRRKQILENIGLKFEILKSNFEENLDKSSFKSPVDYVKETAKQKTIEVASILADKPTPIDLVIGADTVVTHNNVIFEKPRDKTHACEMLKQFSGSIHTVWTAVVLITPINSTVFKGDKLCAEDERFYITEFQESTDVMMTKLTPEIIKSYVDTGETLDKAGGYGIQAIGGSLIEGIKGDYFNVMGFPLHKFCCNVSRIFCHQASE